MIFDRFLVRLGLVLAPFLAPKLAQNRLKIVSRRFLRPYFFKNADFHADLRFPRFFHQNRPQDEAKIGLRSPQDGPKTVLFRIFFASFFASIFGRFLHRFWTHFWTLLGAKLAPTSVKKSTKNRPAPPDRPKTAQERPKSTPRTPQESPREPKRRPRAPKRHPKGTQKHPKGTKENPKGTQESEESIENKESEERAKRGKRQRR